MFNVAPSMFLPLLSFEFYIQSRPNLKVPRPLYNSNNIPTNILSLINTGTEKGNRK